MKYPLHLILLILALVAPSNAVDTGVGETHQTQTSPHLRHLQDEAIDTTCVGDFLQKGDKIHPNESICETLISGETIYFGIFTYPMANKDYTMHRIEIRSTRGTFNRQFSGLGTKNGSPAPYLKLQGDGNFVFGGSGFSLCIVQPGLSAGKLTFHEEGEGQASLQISDNLGGVVWDSSSFTCYPHVSDECVSILEKNQRLSWKEFLCTFNQDGSIAYKFGLSRDMGVLGLWKGSSLIWRPTSRSGDWARGDYLHFQNDGHLTLYKESKQLRTYIWSSNDCIDYTATKLVLTSDGDVVQINYFGSIVWSLQGSHLKTSADISAVARDPRNSLPQQCHPQSYCAVPPSTPLFDIDHDVDIGDILHRPGPGFLKDCGPRCYDMKDNGDDPPYDDPEYGDTMRFAYSEVDADRFRLTAKACITHCDDKHWTDLDDLGAANFGSIGLMVRDSLDPKSQSLFVSHQPFAAADWSYREKQDGKLIEGYNGSQDVECLWLTLERKTTNEFYFFYQYTSYEDDQCGIDEWKMEENTIVFEDMPETVLLGLGVASHVAFEWHHCPHTQARFSEIEFTQL